LLERGHHLAVQSSRASNSFNRRGRSAGEQRSLRQQLAGDLRLALRAKTVERSRLQARARGRRQETAE